MLTELINNIYSRLEDEESKYIFNLRLQLNLDNNMKTFLKGIIDLNKIWKLSPYDDCIQLCKDKTVIIWGAGINGEMTVQLLKQRNIHVNFFCDNDSSKIGRKHCNIPVISVSDVKAHYRDSYIILASQNYAPVFYKTLIDSYFPRENIFYPRIGTLFATNGWQYFDCPNMKNDENEIFIDCGCYDGETSKEFVKWCNGRYQEFTDSPF